MIGARGAPVPSGARKYLGGSKAPGVISMLVRTGGGALCSVTAQAIGKLIGSMTALKTGELEGSATVVRQSFDWDDDRRDRRIEAVFLAPSRMRSRRSIATKYILCL
jgi:hypothetical protein